MTINRQQLELIHRLCEAQNLPHHAS
jgi:hypothetical protein